MKKRMVVFTAFFICLALTFSGSNAHAVSESSSDATILWDTLTITGFTDWDILDENTSSSATAQDDTSSDTDSQTLGFPWQDTSANASVTWASGESFINDNYLISQAYAGAGTGTGNEEANSEAKSYRMGSFQAPGNGFVTISVEHTLWQELSTQYIGERAWGRSEAGLHLENESTYELADDSGLFLNEVADGDYLMDEYMPLALTVEVWFNAGDTGYFDAWARTEARAIPEPTTLTLFGLGLLSFLRYSCRRLKKVV